jgi:hypothetical protein
VGRNTQGNGQKAPANIRLSRQFARTIVNYSTRAGKSIVIAGVHVDGRHRLPREDNRNNRVKEELLIEARLERNASNEVPSLGRRLGKIVCSAVNASANHAA